MHKNQYVTYTTLSAIAVSAILLTSFTAGGMQFAQHALAQNATNATNATSAAPPANRTAFTEPGVGQSFVWHGTVSSTASPLAGHGKEQVATILLPRSDGAVYSGVITYTSSKSVNPQVWTVFKPGNTTAIPKTFGKLTTAGYGGSQYALSDLPSGGSGSIPFSGGAVILHSKSSSPFTATFTVNAVAQPSKEVNNMQSAMALAPPPAPVSKNATSGSSSKSSSPPQPTSLPNP